MKKQWFDNAAMTIGAIGSLVCIFFFIWITVRVPVLLMVSIFLICLTVWISANTGLLNLKYSQKTSLHIYSFLICCGAIFFLTQSHGRAKTFLCEQFIRGHEKSEWVEVSNDEGNIVDELHYVFIPETKIGEQNMALVDLFLSTLGFGSLLFIYHHTSRFNFKHKLKDRQDGK